MRLYVPSTIELLRLAVDTGVIEAPDPVVAESDSEEDEYAAMQTAADLSAGRLDAAGRRVVLVVETERTGAVPITELVAIHADTAPVDPEDTDPPELAWFAVQELGDLLR